MIKLTEEQARGVIHEALLAELEDLAWEVKEIAVQNFREATDKRIKKRLEYLREHLKLHRIKGDWYFTVK